VDFLRILEEDSNINNSFGESFVLASISLKFIKPLFYPDTITVGHSIKEVLGDSLIMNFKIVSHSTNNLVAAGECKCTFVDFGEENIPRRRDFPIPVASLLKEIREFKGIQE
jgi:acyl-CoA thioester hydrolase